MLLYAVIAGVATILFKSLLESLAGYITFRLDRFMKIGTPIEYKGKFGHVKSVSVTQIVLEFQTGYLSLPVRKWTSNEFIVLKDKTLEQK
jgi:hypothetical protein